MISYYTISEGKRFGLLYPFGHRFSGPARYQLLKPSIINTAGGRLELPVHFRESPDLKSGGLANYPNPPFIYLNPYRYKQNAQPFGRHSGAFSNSLPYLTHISKRALA